MKKKLYLYFLIVFWCLLFNDPIENYLKIGVLPEIYSFILFSIAILVIIKKRKVIIYKNDFKIITLTILFFITGILGNTLNEYQSKIYAIISALLTIRFIFAYFTTNTIFTYFNLNKYSKRFNSILKKVTIFIVSVAVIYSVFKIGVVYDSYYHMNSIKLFFGHPTGVNIFCVMLITFLSFYLKQYKENIWYIFSLLILMGLTLKSKAFIFIIIYLIFMLYFCYRNKSNKKWWASRLILIIISIPAFLYGFKAFYVKYFAFKVTYGDTARNVLLETSKVLSREYFPIGTGFGTFASSISGQHYSKLYFDYGIHNTYGMTVENYSFISDSFWPMILGETGIIGIIIFLLIILLLIKNISIYRGVKINAHYFAGYIPILYLFVSSLGESSFAHPAAVGLIFSYTIILITLRNIVRQ